MKKILVVAFIALGVSGFAQTVSNKITFPKGKKLELVAQTKAVITQQVMGQSIEMNVNSNVVHSYDVEEVTKNAATLEHKVKRVQLSMDAMGQAQSFDSDKPEDLKSDIGKSMEKNLKNKYTITVDASGNVVSVKEDNNTATALKTTDNEDMMSNMLSQFVEGLSVPKAGDATSFKILPEGAITKGQSWSTTDTANKEQQGVIKYTVSNITDSEILIDYTADGTVQKTQEAMGMQANVNMKTKTTGIIKLDKTTGLLKQKTINTDGTGTVDVAGQSIPMTNKITSTVTVNEL